MDLCAVITGPTFAEAAQQLTQAVPYADLVELRLDFFSNRSLSEIKQFLNSSPLPVLATLRKASQGGKYTGTEEERKEEIRQILRLSPSYFDLEDDSAASFFAEQYPEVSFVVSHHTFSPPYPPLEPLYESLKGGAYRKIAIAVDTVTAALELLNFAKGKENLILIGLGDHGAVTRILAPCVNIPWCYAPVGTHTAPGQIPLRTLVETYRYPQLSPETKLFGLIGHPVSKSISEHTHNAFFAELGIDAVYVKMDITSEELPNFLEQALKLGFKGLSVTTPLKDKVIPFLGDVNQGSGEIEGVNTLTSDGKAFSGCNTDGAGALNCIGKHTPIQDKAILILGAGPAARAIACEARLRGAVVYIKRREEMAELPPYDIMINATPVQMPICEGQILPGTIAMETNVKPHMSTFLKCAKEKHCTIIHGEEMFVEQAVLQFEKWGLGKAEELYPRLSKIAMRRRLTETSA